MIKYGDIYHIVIGNKSREMINSNFLIFCLFIIPPKCINLIYIIIYQIDTFVKTKDSSHCHVGDQYGSLNILYGQINSHALIISVLYCTMKQKGRYINMKEQSAKEIITTICKAVALAMGVAVVALSALNTIDANTAVTLLGIGLACAGVAMLQKQ